MTNSLSITERIGKLLAQAEGTDNQAERDVFMAKAQSLATHHSVDLAKARHAVTAKERTVPITRQVRLGEKGTRGLNTLVELITNIGSAQGVQATIAHSSTWVNFFGFAEDIDVTEALYASLATQMVTASEEFKATGEWRKDTVYSYRLDDYKPVSWLSARLDFQQAFAIRVGVRLTVARNEAEAEIVEREENRRIVAPHLDEDGFLTPHFIEFFAIRHGLNLLGRDETALELSVALRNISSADEWITELVAEYAESLTAVSDPNAGTALVLADKRKTVNEFYAAETRHIRGSYRGGRSGISSHTSHSAGDRAGRSASLSSSTSLSGSRTAIA